MDFEITKIQKLLEVKNSYCHNFYYIYYGKMYNTEKTKYRKFKYIISFDIFDVMDFFEKDFVTKDNIKEYAHNLENSYLTCIQNFDDEKNIKNFYQYCNQTINDFNQIL